MRHVLQLTGERPDLAPLLESGAPYLRVPLRLDDPGVAPLLLDLRRVFPETLVAFSVVDHGRVPVDGVHLARVAEQVDVVRVSPGEAATVEAFYSTLLPSVELELLTLRNGQTAGSGGSVFAAVVRGRVGGACVVGHAAAGIGPNTIEHLRVDPALAPPDYEDVWNGLARAAVCQAARHGDHVVSALHPADRPLAVRAGLLGPDPEQHVVISATRRDDVHLRVAAHIAARRGTLPAAA